MLGGAGSAGGSQRDAAHLQVRAALVAQHELAGIAPPGGPTRPACGSAPGGVTNTGRLSRSAKRTPALVAAPRGTSVISSR